MLEIVQIDWPETGTTTTTQREDKTWHRTREKRQENDYIELKKKKQDRWPKGESTESK